MISQATIKTISTSIATTAATKIWDDFSDTSIINKTAEYPVNNTYSIYAWDEQDVIDNTHWININLKKYNSQGKCVKPYLVCIVTEHYTKEELYDGIYKLIHKFYELGGNLFA